MDENTKIQIRLNLVMNVDKPLAEIKEIYEWVLGQPSSIIPIKDFKVVKPQ